MNELDEHTLRALLTSFAYWAHPHQIAPPDDWRTWVILGGRGAGKTRAGAEWVRARIESGQARRVALVGETYDQAREVMVLGDSGILACAPRGFRPEWIATRRCLRFPNGAEAMCFSAQDPEALRGPQFDAAWIDELAKWKRGQDTWDMLQFALRLGDAPQVCVTTTPRAVTVLRDLLENPSTVCTHAPSEANKAYLAQSFLTEVRARYAGSRLGRQELDGVLLDAAEGAFWSHSALDQIRISEPPVFDRVVVAVDPPVTSKTTSDACGIIVVGAITTGPPQNWRAVVLQDASLQGASPVTWATRAVGVARDWKAERIVAEVNQGGDLVSAVIRQVDALIPISAVHASRSKAARAEPVAALYEQGRVSHLPGLAELEDEMCHMTVTGHQGTGSPDRVDALVWALTEALITPANRWRHPRMRVL